MADCDDMYVCVFGHRSVLCRSSDLDYSGFAAVPTRCNLGGQFVLSRSIVDRRSVFTRRNLGGKLVLSRGIVDRRCVHTRGNTGGKCVFSCSMVDRRRVSLYVGNHHGWCEVRRVRVVMVAVVCCCCHRHHLGQLYHRTECS